MTKKILMTTMSLDIGGAETHIAELSRALAADGYDVTVASGGGVYVETLERAGIKHVTLPLYSKNPRHVLASYRGLRRLIRAEQYDIVHAHARIPAFVCGLLSRRLNFRFVTTAHGTYDVTPLWRMVTNWGEKSLAVSYDIKEYLTKSYGVPSDNVTLTVNGIDTARFSSEADAQAVVREFALPPSEHRVLYVSRLDRSCVKAGFDLIEAAQTLAPVFPDLQVVLVGAGDAENAVRAAADKVNRAVGKKLIVLAGARTDVESFCAWANVFVGVSRAALEAMSAGCMTVLTGAQGALGIFRPELLTRALDTNFTCRGYACEDANELGRDLETLLSLSGDEQARMGAYNRSVVEQNYSIRRMAQDAEQIYDSLTPAKRYRYGEIVIGGYYGFSNIGDDSLLQVIIDQLRQNDPQIRITVLSRSPRRTARTFLVHSVSRFNPVCVFRALLKARLLIFGGGSQLQSVTSGRSLSYYLFLLKIAHRMNVRTVLFANGVGPFSRKRDELRAAETLEQVDLITLRDSRSFDKIRALGVRNPKIYLSADPAFTMREADRGWCAHLLSEAGLSPHSEYFVMSLRAWRNLDPAVKEKMTRFCTLITERTGLIPLFIPMQIERDRSLCEELAASTNGRLLEKLSPSEVRTIIAGASFVCGMRLHLLIYAAAAGVPAIGLSYDPKIDAFFSDLSCNWIMSAAQINTDALLSYADQALAADKDALASAAEQLRQKALVSMEKLKELL